MDSEFEDGDVPQKTIAERLLDRGIVPDEFKGKAAPVTTLGMAIASYLDEVHTTADDVGILNGLHEVLKGIDLAKVNYAWAEGWVKELRADNLAPSTIRKKVGALARCLDWVLRREDTMLANNPLRVLPKRYASYPYSTGRSQKAGRGRFASPCRCAQADVHCGA